MFKTQVRAGIKLSILQITPDCAALSQFRWPPTHEMAAGKLKLTSILQVPNSVAAQKSKSCVGLHCQAGIAINVAREIMLSLYNVRRRSNRRRMNQCPVCNVKRSCLHLRNSSGLAMSYNQRGLESNKNETRALINKFLPLSIPIIV